MTSNSRGRISAIHEAVANLRSRIGLSLVVVAVTAGTMFGMTSLSIIEVSAIGAHQDSLVAQGQYVFQVFQEQRRPFAGTECEAVNTSDGVVSAGGLASSESIQLFNDDTTQYWLDRATQGYARLMWPTLDPSQSTSLVVGNDLSNRFGLLPGSYIPLTSDGETQSSLQVSQTPGAVERDKRYRDRVVLTVDPTEQVTSCLVESVPGAQADVGTILANQFPADLGYVVQPLVPESNSGFTPQETYDQRLTLWTSPAAGALVVLVLLAVWHGRVSEFGLYRFLGLGRGFILRLICTEAVVLLVAPASIGITGAILTLSERLNSSFIVETVLLDVLICASISFLALPLGLLVVGLREPTRVLKEST